LKSHAFERDRPAHFAQLERVRVVGEMFRLVEAPRALRGGSDDVLAIAALMWTLDLVVPSTASRASRGPRSA
jgi:hypothetical protein